MLSSVKEDSTVRHREHQVFRGNRLIIATAATVLGGPTVFAQQAAPTIEALWAVVQQQQMEIEALKQTLSSAEQDIATTSERLDLTDERIVLTGDYVESLEIPTVSDTTIGGYGEMHYNNLDRDSGEDIDEIDFHRFVLFFGHRFSDRIRFFSELEVEHSLAGDGKPGEVELEQAFIDFRLSDTLSAQTGLFLLPVGIMNETHEPTAFYGVERNDVENIIIPSTWWEAGAAIKGNLSNGLSWDFALHSGLAMPTTGGSAFRVRSGRQKVAEAMASDPAYTFRLRYTGIPGLDLAASYQYQSDPSQMASDGLDSGSLFSAHAIYQTGDFTLRGLYGQWSFDGALVELADDDRQSGWYIEPSYRVNSRWGVYARYEDLEGARDIDEFTQWEAGLNYWPQPGVVIKFDYRRRDHELLANIDADFDGFDLGVGYQF